jgi:hypothetical protein
MQRQVEWAGSKPGAGDILLSAQSDTEAFYGHLAKARATLRRASESASRNSQEGTAALWITKSALQEGEVRNIEPARQALQSGLAMAQTRHVQTLAVITSDAQVIWFACAS